MDFDVLRVINENDTNIFKLELKKPSKILLKTLFESKILPDVKIHPSYKTFSFHAKNVSTFSDYLERNKERNQGIQKIQYNDALNILWCLSKQIFHLEKYNYTFYRYTMKNILVVDDFKFIYVNYEDILPFKDKDSENSKYQILFIEPFSLDGFLSPEILRIRSIPSFASSTSIYYSLSAIIYFSLFGLYPKGENGEKEKVLTESMRSIASTKLYWFLLRNLIVGKEKERTLFLY